MTYKIGIISITSLVFMSGCFSLSTPEVAEKEANFSQEEIAASADQLPASNAEIGLAEQLRAQTNLYEINKKDLSRKQRDHMIGAVNALQSQNIADGLSRVAAAEALGTLTSASYVVKADLLMANDDTQAAKQALEQSLAVNPYNPKAANRLATRYREEGQFETALEYYTRAIKAVPMYAPSYRNRGILNDLYLLDKVSAIEDYETYSALLEYENVELQSKDVEKSIKLVKRWIVDVDRQLQRIVSNSNGL